MEMVIAAVIGLILGGFTMFAFKRIQEQNTKKTAQSEAQKIIQKAQSESAKLKKESELKSKEIIEGIANLEMGFEPCIPQDLVFFCPLTTNALHIYDDRGCDIWSNDKETLRIIYKSLNDWILDYNRKEIDETASRLK